MRTHGVEGNEGGGFGARGGRRTLLRPGLLLLLVLAGCQGGPGEPFPPAIPAAALAFLAPERITTERVGAGVIYRSIQGGDSPWMVHLLEVDTQACEVGFRVIGLEDEERDRRTVLDLARSAGEGVLAAVNGDFYSEDNRPIGIEVREGVVRGRTPRPVFAWRPGDPPRLASVGWEEEVLRIGGDWVVVPGEPDGGTQAVAGFPALLRDGLRVGDLEAADRPGFSTQRHPRTALGWDPYRSVLWIVVADGRREGVAEGMTLDELATLFETLGAREALNLDGGGSSTMVVGGRVVSRPSDPSGARPVVNALVVREDPALCALPGAREGPR